MKKRNKELVDMQERAEETTNNLTIKDAERTYQSVRGYIVEAQHQIYRSVNTAMVEAYWKIGKDIYEACGENERAAYGKQMLADLSERLTAEFGKGFDESNLRTMRRFYRTFPIRDALRPELSWTHYRELMRVPNRVARQQGQTKRGRRDPTNRTKTGIREDHQRPVRT